MAISTSGSLTGTRLWLFGAAIALAIAEFVDAFFVDVPVMAIIFGLLVAASAFWLRARGTKPPVVILMVLGAMELISVLFVYPNSDDPPAMWDTALFAALTLAVVVFAAMTLLQARQGASVES